MAEEKSSFILYADYLPMVSKLTDAKAGKLFKLILEYVNDKNPVVQDALLQVAFEPIKQQLKRDLKKWEGTRGKRSEAGKKGAEARWQKMANDGNRINGMAKMAVNVNVNDNVKEIAIFSIEHCLTVALNDERWVSANKTNESELKEFNRLLEGRGVYQKNPLDYKTHFHNWKKSGKKEERINEPSVKLRTI